MMKSSKETICYSLFFLLLFFLYETLKEKLQKQKNPKPIFVSFHPLSLSTSAKYKHNNLLHFCTLKNIQNKFLKLFRQLPKILRTSSGKPTCHINKFCEQLKNLENWFNNFSYQHNQHNIL